MGRHLELLRGAEDPRNDTVEADWATPQASMLTIDIPATNNAPSRKRDVVLPNDDFGAEGHILLANFLTSYADNTRHGEIS